MFTTHKTLSRSLAAALIAAGTLFHAATASAASTPTTDSSPSSQQWQENWKRAKFPWLVPTTAAASNAPSTPVLSQQEIWMRAKFPWNYRSAVRSEEPSVSAPVLRQQEIWKRAKFPFLYRTDSEATRSH